MRSFIGIVVLVLAAIGLAMFASHMHPGGDLPPDEQQALVDKAAADAKTAASDKRKAGIDHSAGAFDAVSEGVIHTTIRFEGKPPIGIDLYPKAAPKTVAHITDLIKKGFYNKIKVHRLETDKIHLFQFGDPESAKFTPDQFQASAIGAHGSGEGTVPLEVKLPQVMNSVGLARTEAEDSGDSQIYINTADNPVFDGDYCIFGRVVSGQVALPLIKVGDVIKSFTIN